MLVVLPGRTIAIGGLAWVMVKLCDPESVQGEYEHVNMRVRAHTRGCMYVYMCLCVCVCVCVWCARARVSDFFANSTDRHWFMNWSNAKSFMNISC